MDPLKFLNIENPQIQQARFSGLAGQKAGLMKDDPPKQSVGGSAVQGAIGGAIAGASMAANMGAFNDSNPTPSATQTAGTEAYGDRTAPTIKPGPSAYQGRTPSVSPQRSQAESMIYLLGPHYR